MNHSLPPGWCQASIGELAGLIRGVSYDKADAVNTSKSEYLPILRATNISSALTFNDLVYVPNRNVSEEQLLRRGDIILAASSGSLSVVGKAAQLKKDWEGSFGAFCMGVRSSPRILSSYVSYFMQTLEYRSRVSDLAAGSNINNLKRDHINSFPIRLAPRREQDRIVSKIEELFSDLDAGVTALERAKANLTRYRAAVLKAAVKGKLTAEWRKKHPDAEPASKLLERILAERRKKWEEAELTKYAAAKKTPPKDWREKYLEPEPPDTKDLPDIPEGWCWATIEQCTWEVTVGHVGSMKTEYVCEGIPFLRSQNVRPLRWDREGIRHISKEFHRRLSKSRLKGGELLVVRSGVNLGDACIYPPSEPEANCSDLVISRFMDPMTAEYAALYVISPVGRSSVGSRRTGSAIGHFNVGAMERSPIPLPPRSEQGVIVQEVQEVLSRISRLEIDVAKAAERSGVLRGGILRKAFVGGLVIQDPKDEPASLLLERIRADRGDPKPPKSRASARKPTTKDTV